jgi:hypothetical protein
MNMRWKKIFLCSKESFQDVEDDQPVDRDSRFEENLHNTPSLHTIK